MSLHRNDYPVWLMAKTLGVSCSGYYASLKVKKSDRAFKQECFDIEVLKEYRDSRKNYGRVRLAHAFAEKGRIVNHKRISSSLKRQNIKTRRSRRRVKTTQSNHDFKIADNLLNRNFSAEYPNQKYVTDITYLPTRKDSWIYLTTFIDLYSRKVVGWNVSDSLKSSSVLSAFEMAIKARKPAKGLLIHSDRGVQYCCNEFRTATKRNGFIQSMSRKGNCWDNAVSESFFSTLKTEMVGDDKFNDLQDAEVRLFDYIEVFYNRKRLHSALGYKSPESFEMTKLQKCA